MGRRYGGRRHARDPGAPEVFVPVRCDAAPMRLPRPTNPLLSGRDGRLFLSAQALDALAVGISAVALPWLVLDGGGSAGAAGLVATMALVPYVLFGLVAGVVGDRFARRQLLLGAHTVQALAAIVIPLWTFEAGTPPIGVVLAAAFVIGACRVFADAAAFGAVCLHRRPRALHRGPGDALGGVVDRPRGRAGGGRRAHRGDRRGRGAGGRVRRLRARRGAAPADARPPRRAAPTSRGSASARRCCRDCGSSAASPSSRPSSSWRPPGTSSPAGVLTLLVPLLRDEIGLSSAEAGWALAIGAAMGVVAAPLVGPLDRRFGGVTIVLWGTVVNGVTALGVGLAFGFWALLPAICALYLAEWVTMAAFIGERQRRAPPHLQARVGISGRTINMASATVGAALASAATEFTGPARDLRRHGRPHAARGPRRLAADPPRGAALAGALTASGRARQPAARDPRRPAVPRRAGPRLRGAGRRERGAAVADPGRGRLDARRRARVHA